MMHNAFNKPSATSNGLPEKEWALPSETEKIIGSRVGARN